MTTIGTLPAIDACMELYVWVHDRYGGDAFSVDSLEDKLGGHDDWARGSTEERSTSQLLDLLVAYGLFTQHRDGRYRVRCAPDERRERWRAKAVDRTESLHRAVQRTRGQSGATSLDDPEWETLAHDGEEFVSVTLNDTDDFDSAETRLSEALDASPDCVGIVLRAPGELAAEVQRFADRQCGDEPKGGRDHSFEKVTTDLVGENKNALEFRLYLREAGAN